MVCTKFLSDTETLDEEDPVISAGNRTTHRSLIIPLSSLRSQDICKLVDMLYEEEYRY